MAGAAEQEPRKGTIIYQSQLRGTNLLNITRKGFHPTVPKHQRMTRKPKNEEPTSETLLASNQTPTFEDSNSEKWLILLYFLTSF